MASLKPRRADRAEVGRSAAGRLPPSRRCLRTEKPAEAGFSLNHRGDNRGQQQKARGSPDRIYFFGGSNPRSFFIASMLGARPRQAAYILARSSVLPRDSTIWRKRSPLARVRPPCSSNQP